MTIRFQRGRRLRSLLLAVLFTIGILPPVEVRAAGETHEFSSGAVVLDSEYDGDTVIIRNGVFSVTVNGAQNVSIRFVDVTIDRRHNPNINISDPMNGTVVPDLYEATQKLEWGTSAPTCPFLITNGATVTAGFSGTCTFYAGTNGGKVAADGTYTASRTGSGYAAIQVDAGSALTITDAEKLTVYGAHQLGVPDENGEVTVDGTTVKYSDALRANTTISTAGYTEVYGQIAVPDGATVDSRSGGAGIGGGAAYDTDSSAASSYTQGTPGAIIINGGNIEAFGGHQAAGIGGGVNSAAGQITINGGTVVAHGGRWAAGIGDGDSYYRATSTKLTENNSRIEINGGAVTAYGGVAAPGIGSSDEIDESAMQIAVNGGAVKAFSGFPDDFSGAADADAYPDEAPAAIGAGSDSNMQSNSIYISSEANLLCAGFGNYSLTENGTKNTTVPTIAVDQEGYLLLLRTGEYFSSGERVLKLWKPQTEEIPGIGTCVKYTIQETGEIYYCCDDPEGNRIAYRKDGDSYRQVTEELNGLTLYVDENSQPLEDGNGDPIQINLAYYFRSMALTLPDPQVHGGLYAITVPTDGVSADEKPANGADIILTVEAYEQGTQSGTITYPSNHNMNLDDTADRLTDLDVYPDSSTRLPEDGLIGGKFEPGVFAYTVYVEPDVSEVDLWAEFEDADITYTVTLDGTELVQVPHGDALRVHSTIDLTGGTEKTVRLKKQDGTYTLGAIVYKITIIKKSEYALQLSDPSKVYDGRPVSVKVNGSYGYNVFNVVGPTLLQTPATEVVTATGAGDSHKSTVYIETTGFLFWEENYIADLTMSWMVGTTNSDGGDTTVQYILQVDTSQNSSSGTISGTGSFGMGWTVTYDASGKISTTIIADDPTANVDRKWLYETGSNNKRTIATGNNYSLQLQIDATGSVTLYRGKSSYSSIATLFSIAADAGTSTVPVNTQADAETAANAAAAAKTAGRFPYEISSTVGITQPLTIYTVTRSGSSNIPSEQTVDPVPVSGTKTYQEVGCYEVVGAYDPAQPGTPVSIPEDELAQTQLTWYQISEEDGETTEELLPGPPTDAGTYRVDGALSTQSYNAYGSQEFTITPREVRVLQITNWLLYVKMKPVENTLPIDDPGKILLENVVSGDDVTLSVDSAGGNVFYNETSLTYNSEKITLKDAELTGERAFNYTLHYDEDKLIFVFGQIALDVQGSTFRKTLEGSWRKYFPDPDGAPVGDPTNPPDYHSPAIDGVYRSHSEYVLARTVNGDSGARYAVDIEYGAMQFGFYRSIWDVNQLSYVDNEDSTWAGMDGTNNRIILTNYSNADIWYQISAVIDPFYAAIDAVRGIRAKVAPDADGAGTIAPDTWTSVAAATPGDSGNTGSSGSEDCYLILSGVPQMQESSTYTEVGTITVTVAPAVP